ncbi:hypothetical protein DRQ18_07865 [bacterium]|nr:MAG: hypothetical protein DRQ18_07865 [bacterium]
MIAFLGLFFLFSSEFYIAPGDNIRIIIRGPDINSDVTAQVSNEGEYPLIIKKTEITPDGTPYFISEVLTVLKAGGLKVEEVKKMIEDTVRTYLGNVKVNTFIISPRYTVTINIGGEENTPGEVKDYNPVFTIWDYISRTQGINVYGVIEDVYIIKRNGEKIYIPPESVFTYIPEWGDVIYIPKKHVFVEGAVPVPGAYPYVEGEGPLYYIGLAGGEIPHRGNLGSAYVIRARTGEKISIRKVTKIEPNDKIVVPERLFTLKDMIQMLPSLVSMGVMIYTVFFVQSQ